MANNPIDPILRNDFSSGNIRNVSEDKRPISAVPYSNNFIYDENIGEATLRKGTALVGDQIVDEKPVLGLVNFRDNGSDHALLAVSSDGTNNDIYKLAGGNWDTKSLEDDTKDLKTRFAQFLDSLLRINGTDGAKSFDGTSWITTGGVFDLANLPTSNFVAVYKDRVHVMDESGVLYSSSVPRWYLAYDAQTANFNVGARLTGGTSGATGIIFKDTDAGATGTLQLTGVIGTFVDGETLTDDKGGSATSNANATNQYQISWTDGYITTPIDPDNGFKGKATGLGIIGGLMFIFFERAFYTWNGSATQADPIADIGCSSQESIDTCDGFMFFANKDGIYMTQGGFPQRISRYQQDYFDNMASSFYSEIAGGCDGKHYYCSIGSTTVEGITKTNTVLRYSIKSQEFAPLSYPTRPLVFSRYIDGTDVKLLFGNGDGNVIQIDSSDPDDNYTGNLNTAIEYELHIGEITEPSKGLVKTVSDRAFVYTRQSSGAKFQYSADKNDNRQEDWKTLGEIKKDNQAIRLPSIKYKKLRFKVSGVSKKGRFVFEGLECPTVRFKEKSK